VFSELISTEASLDVFVCFAQASSLPTARINVLSVFYLRPRDEMTMRHDVKWQGVGSVWRVVCGVCMTSGAWRVARGVWRVAWRVQLEAIRVQRAA
jgi:hypothetical protein